MKYSHDVVNRYLLHEKITANLVWEHAKGDIVQSKNGYLLFDDSVLDKNYSKSIELVRRQYSGNAHAIIKGIGMVNCLYFNPDTGQYWIVDYRIFDPDGDGKTKIDHVKEMLIAAIANKQLAFSRVLMDTWYATKELMLLIERLNKVYYCPLKNNRLVDDSGGVEEYKQVSSLHWNNSELKAGKLVKIRGFPALHKVKLFRVESSTTRTDFVATNDLSQNSTQATQDVCSLRWKIEQFHREIKQVTGIEKCQCRKARIQRNHIACAVLVWLNLTKLAKNAFTNVYQLKQQLLSKYLRQELISPALKMSLA